MKLEYTDKFEYKYEPLRSSIESSINALNLLGEQGWELIELIKPKSGIVGELYKAILKRKIYTKNI